MDNDMDNDNNNNNNNNNNNAEEEEEGGNNMDFTQMSDAMDKLDDAAMMRYITNHYTAAVCLQELETALLAMRIEPDDSVVWQV
jgi:hypothetical protein